MKPTKETTIAINTIATLAVATFVVMGATFILFYYLDSATGIKDAWSTIAGFFGGFATLTAAYIASRLFNDWKEQHNLQIIALEAKNAFHLFHKQADQIFEFISTIEDIEKNESEVKLSERSIAIDFQNTILEAYNIDKVTMGSFWYLTKGRKIYDLSIEYYIEIKKIDKILANKANENFSNTRFLNKQSASEFLKLLSPLEGKNNAILDELKNYIFLK